jgi:Fe-S oxidoreductase
MTSRKPLRTERLYFAPGCALMLYKPDLAERILTFLNEKIGKVELLLTCCQHDPRLPRNSRVINVCPGCDKRFGKNYTGISTVSLWELINETDSLTMPDYKGKKMSVIDACPTREEERVQDAIRDLLVKMNIELIEPANTRKESTCCGDLYYDAIPTPEVKELMIEKAISMPADDIVVHCVSCVKAMFNGGKKPRYLADLLFDEETTPGVTDLDEWHDEIKEFIAAH